MVQRGVTADPGLRHALERFVKSPMGTFRRKKDESFWGVKRCFVRSEGRRSPRVDRTERIGQDDAAENSFPDHQTDHRMGGYSWPCGVAAGGRHGLPSGTDWARERFSEWRDLWDAQSEIERKFDEIVAFSELDKFIDTPVKHYSSGMYLRLAFAVAAHMEPEFCLWMKSSPLAISISRKNAWGK